ncbi:MAG: formate dehydrogenase-N subunit alpha [Chloroflexi bacterium]|nr:formate dehydrogenase-N subunit alpha [Chloroflexota bacterium]
MHISRRQFLKLGAGVGGISALAGLTGRQRKALAAVAKRASKQWGKETTTVCPFCGSGCGFIVGTEGGKLVNLEGDPDHPINGGAACSKGAALAQVHNNERRLKSVLYRPPGGTEWQVVEWDWALDRIAARIKSTRDSYFTERDDQGRLVNRAEAIASLGGAALDNEECYTISKAMRALGVCRIEHQARLCHSTTVTSLAASFGRGAMTNHWNDIANSDCILAIGANPAENHPASFQWINKAREKGAILISADPRFTRTSSRADIYCKFRSGTDIAFIGGMINYVINQMERYPQEFNMAYVTEYSNASFLVRKDFQGPGDLDGLFSGYAEATRAYDRTTWDYERGDDGWPKKDPTLKAPNCVFQLLKKHFARYDIDTVCNITGTPKDTYLDAVKTFAATGSATKAGTILYAMGTTQHTVGTQNIRAYGILQLLLANIGISGGGINAMRGESNVQGSTDHAMLWNVLPGYLAVNRVEDTTLAQYTKKLIPSANDSTAANWWQNSPKYVVSMLKAWYGEHATKDNEFGYNYLPKVARAYDHMAIFEEMSKGDVKGFLLWGQNPAVGGPNSTLERRALENLEWMVAVDLWETETAAFWKRPGADTAAIKTEVFLLPAAASYEKEGSITNSGRWAQWRYKAVEPPGQARADLDILTGLVHRLKDLYAVEPGPNAEAILNLTWDYGDPPDPARVAKEINGYDLATGKLMGSFANLKDDGTTSSGNWIYCGSFPEAGNLMARRSLNDPTGMGMYPEWAWSWPVNRRIIYNRASVDLNGRPWNPDKPVIWWDEAQKKWMGDIPDGGQAPIATDPEHISRPFIMKPSGHASLFCHRILADGPLPEHYEPWESPIDNPLSRTQFNPAAVIWKGDLNPRGDSRRYPIVATTFRLSEHWQAGQMTRNLPWLVELFPEMFVEVCHDLAMEKGIKDGDRVTLVSARGIIECNAVVTHRLQPLQINGRVVHQVALPWHWGYMGLATGPSANLLTPHVGDANTMMPEFKTFLCNVEKAPSQVASSTVEKGRPQVWG